jgi:hypothetical protein
MTLRHRNSAIEGQSVAMANGQFTSVSGTLALAFLIVAASQAPLRSEPQTPPVAAGDCAARLAGMGIETASASLPSGAASPLCAIEQPIVLVSVTDAAMPLRRIHFPGKPILSCAMAEQMASFATEIVAPLALGNFGKELVAINTGPGYECRPRNRQVGAKISSHGQGNAVDIMGVEILGGRKIVIEKPDGPESIRFIAGVRAAACGVFSTVLGPGSDPSHANHLHFDTEKRGYNGRSKLCQ